VVPSDTNRAVLITSYVDVLAVRATRHIAASSSPGRRTDTAPFRRRPRGKVMEMVGMEEDMPLEGGGMVSKFIEQARDESRRL